MQQILVAILKIHFRSWLPSNCEVHNSTKGLPSRTGDVEQLHKPILFHEDEHEKKNGYSELAMPYSVNYPSLLLDADITDSGIY